MLPLGIMPRDGSMRPGLLRLEKLAGTWLKPRVRLVQPRECTIELRI